MKKTLTIILVVVIIGCCIGGYFIYRQNAMYISKNEAMEIALADAGLKTNELIDSSVDFEKTRNSAWYDVEFDTHGMEYDYSIDAGTGAILSSNAKAD